MWTEVGWGGGREVYLKEEVGMGGGIERREGGYDLDEEGDMING